MNKQELIEKIRALPYEEGVAVDTFNINRAGLIKLIEQFDEPQKVTIPQFVAEYIEFKKKYDFHVYGAMRGIEDHYDKRVQEWFYEGNIETFVRAWLDGYRIEEEKRYRVKAKGVCFNSCLIFEKINKTWLFSSIYETDHQRENHTRKELEEAGFGEVFHSPMFEVEEVE